VPSHTSSGLHNEQMGAGLESHWANMSSNKYLFRLAFFGLFEKVAGQSVGFSANHKNAILSADVAFLQDGSNSCCWVFWFYEKLFFFFFATPSISAVRQQSSKRHNRSPAGLLFASMFQNHPNRTDANFSGKLIRCFVCHCSILSGAGASDNPGAVHLAKSLS